MCSENNTVDYGQKYKEALYFLKDLKPYMSDYCVEKLEGFFPELRESEDERIRKELINFFSKGAEYDSSTNGIKDRNIIAWLEKQGGSNPYSGTSFDYNGHTWGMCAREDGVDILCDSQLIKHIEKQGEQKPWSEEDERILNRIQLILEFYDRNYAFSGSSVNGVIPTAMPKSEIPKYVDWLKSLKPQNRWKPSEEQMAALVIAVHDANGRCHYEKLFSIYNDLKKL